jgi:hypothetical protein
VRDCEPFSESMPLPLYVSSRYLVVPEKLIERCSF